MKDVKTSLGHPRYTHRLARIIKMPSVSHYLNANLPWCTLSLMPHYRCVPEQRRVDSLPISLACFMLSFAKGDEADIYIRPWCDNTTCVDSVTPRFKTWWSLDIQANKKTCDPCPTLMWSVCRFGQAGIYEHTDSNCTFCEIIWDLVFCHDSGVDKRVWVDSWKSRVTTGRAAWRDEKILSQIWGVFAECTEVKLCCLLFHLHPDKPGLIRIQMFYDMQVGDERGFRKLDQHFSSSRNFIKVYWALTAADLKS